MISKIFYSIAGLALLLIVLWLVLGLARRLPVVGPVAGIVERAAGGPA